MIRTFTAFKRAARERLHVAAQHTPLFRIVEAQRILPLPPTTGRTEPAGRRPRLATRIDAPASAHMYTPMAQQAAGAPLQVGLNPKRGAPVGATDSLHTLQGRREVQPLRQPVSTAFARSMQRAAGSAGSTGSAGSMQRGRHEHDRTARHWAPPLPAPPIACVCRANRRR